MSATIRSSTRRRAAVLALVCAWSALFWSGSEAQAPSQSQGIAIPANSATLCALVGKTQTITFRYVYDPPTAEPRQLEPYAVGYTQRRNVLLFGRQVNGYSKSAEAGSGDLPGWRSFRVDKIRMGMVNASGSTFDPMQPGPNEHRFISEFVCKNETVQ
jgi:hypothetical protein